MPNLSYGMGTTIRPAAALIPDSIRALLTQQSNVLTLSGVELSNQLSQQLAMNPGIAVIIDNAPAGSGGFSRFEEEEWDPEEFYDTPNMEENIETGEGREEYFLPYESETFFQYAWRRLEEDFDSDYEEDRTVKKKIGRILEELTSPVFSLLDIPEDLRPWFKELKGQYPVDESMNLQFHQPAADIIFRFNGSKLDYEIDLGLLDRIKFNDNGIVGSEEPLILFDINILPSQLPEFIHARRVGLSLLAEFLLKKQPGFFGAGDFNFAREKLQSVMQKDFADYCIPILNAPEKVKEKKDQSENTTGKEKMNSKEGWASRIINNKWVEIPFHGKILPAKFFFNELIGAINALKKAIEIRVFEQEKPWISATNQTVILKALGVKDVKSRNIRKTYTPLLKNIYPEAVNGGIKKISDSDLTSLINRVGKALELTDKDFEVDKIAKLMREAE